MLNIFVVQLLPLLLALLGAILGVAVGFYIGPHVSSRTASLSIAVLIAITVGAIVYLIADGIAQDRKVQRLAAVIREEADLVTTIEYEMRQAMDAHSDEAPFNFIAFRDRIEDWRNRVDRRLRQELPESGADIRFRAGSGQIGAGPVYFEYTRIGILRANLMAVLDSLPSYVQRSQ